MTGRINKLLVAGQVVCLAVAGVALYVALKPGGEDEMRRSRFYQDGATAGQVITSDVIEADYTTCEGGLSQMYKDPRLPDFAKPQSAWDVEAFLLGCEESTEKLRK